MGIGCILVGVSFLVMIPPSFAVAGGEKVSMLWLAACIFVLTVGEIYLSPVGLSLVTKVAPARMVSMLMGTWFLSSFFGNYLCGYIGTYWEKTSKEMFFIVLAAMAIGAGLGILLVGSPLRRAISRGQDETADL
jgi:POT family proton-dependent oligopeptide transporter